MKTVLLLLFCFFTSPVLGLAPKAEPFEYSEASLQPIFDDFWKNMNEKYSYYFLKPNVDWAKLKEKHRAKVLAAKNEKEFVEALRKMLEPLNDIHVFLVDSSGKRVDTGKLSWIYNGNRQVVLDQLDGTLECEKFAVVGKTNPDGFGYFLMENQSDATKAAVADAVSMIRDLNDAPGFIVDLRRSNGGSEPLAIEVAKMFCGQPVVYATSKYRNGPGHKEFSEPLKRILPAGLKGETFTKAVVCLVGPGCISSGEGFAKMMKALPHVTLVGLPTAGASGNPKPIKLGGTGVVAYYSSWVDMLPDGTVFEGQGIKPTIEVKMKDEEYKNADPTLEKALEVLRKAAKK